MGIEALGFSAATQLVNEGKRDPDIAGLSDTALFENVLETSWYTSNRRMANTIVLAYVEGSSGGRDIWSTDRWWEPLVDDRATLVRTN